VTWTVPPRMEDLAALAKIAAEEPIETHLRLEQLRRELADAVKADPVRVANFGIVMATGHAMQDRQLRHALLLLAQRQDCIEVLTARVMTLERHLVREQGQRQRPWPVNVARG
jgi:hypothetical protein